jgi:hypothetical protein
MAIISFLLQDEMALTRASYTLQTIEEGVFKGKQFRHTNERPMRVSVIDWIMAITGQTKDNAGKMLRRIVQGDPAVRTKMSELQFEGERQRPTPVTDSKGLLFILDKLPRKYVAQFQQERDTILARYLGGDTSIGEEVQAIREAQEQATPDNPMRVFGEAVESGDVGHLSSTTPSLAVLWHQKRDETKELTKQKAAAIKQNVPGANVGTYARNNARICQVTTGHTPAKFKTIAGLPRYRSARDGMTVGQLGAVMALEEMATNMAGPDMESPFNQASALIAEGLKIGGFHGRFIRGPPKLTKQEKQQLLVLSSNSNARALLH